jgi:hypothetical protein
MILLKTLFIICLMAIPLTATAIFTTNKVVIKSPSSTKEYKLFNIDIQLAQLGINEQLSPLVNNLFLEINTAKYELQNNIRSALLAVPEVERVNYSLVTTYPLQLNLTQTNNSLVANMNGLGVSVGGVADTGIPVFCSNIHFNLSIQNIDITLAYDLFNGNLNLSSVDYDLNTSASCSGLFGFLGTIFTQSYFENAVEESIDNAIRDIEGTLQMEQLFSIRDLTDDIVSLPIGNTPSEIQNTLLSIRDLMNGININTNISVGAEFSQDIFVQYEGGFSITFKTNVLTLSSNL